MPQSFDNNKIFSAIDTPLWGGGSKEKFKIILLKVQLRSIKWAVKEIYPLVLIEV